MTDIEKNSKAHGLRSKSPSSYSDTVLIDLEAAVFYSPDPLQLQRTRSTTDTSAFDADMHEFEFLMKTARKVLDQQYPHLNIINVEKARYLLFVRSDNSRDCIDLNSKADPFGLFAFNRKDAPAFLDMANIETELGFYFGGK